MKIGLVIVNYNDYENTKKLVDNIISYKSITSIVIVDNNSFEEEKEKLLKIKNKKVTILENDNNYGYAYALNIGAKYLINTLGACLICFSNTDIKIPNEEVIIKLSKMIDDETKCVMPKIKEHGKFKYGWKLTPVNDDLKLSIPYFNRQIRKKLRDYKDDYFKTREAIVDVIYGCFFMVDSSALMNIDFFDDKVFLYYEEYILAHKLKYHNYLSKINTSIYVEHIHNTSIGNNISKLNKYKIYKKSQLYYEKKYNNANIIQMFLFKIFYLINLIPYRIKLLKKN